MDGTKKVADRPDIEKMWEELRRPLEDYHLRGSMVVAPLRQHLRDLLGYVYELEETLRKEKQKGTCLDE